jgi:hypothetical protein
MASRLSFNSFYAFSPEVPGASTVKKLSSLYLNLRYSARTLGVLVCVGVLAVRPAVESQAAPQCLAMAAIVDPAALGRS